MQCVYPCSSSGRLWWTPALHYKHVWSVDDRCEDLPGSLGLWDLLWTHRISCLHHHCQMGVWPLNDTFLFTVLSNSFSVFLLLLLILLNLFMILSLYYLSHLLLHDLDLILSFLNFFLLFFSSCPLVLFCTLFYFYFFSFLLFLFPTPLPLFPCTPLFATFRLLPLPLRFPLTTKSISRSLEFWVCLFCGCHCYFSCRRWSSWGRCILRRRCTRSRSVQAAASVLSLWCCVSILRWKSNEKLTTHKFENTKIISRHWDYLPYILTYFLFLNWIIDLFVLYRYWKYS